MGLLDMFRKPKGSDKSTSDEVTVPARIQVEISQERLSRIERILQESREAEAVVRRVRANHPKRY